MTPSSVSPVVISGSGIWVPSQTITNAELVGSYNTYARTFNESYAEAISAGRYEEKPLSSEKFIEKASGIKSRHVYAKEGMLEIDRMRPLIRERSEDEQSDQAEIAVYAAKEAMARARKTVDDIDMVIVACTYTQRAYPSIAVEVQRALGIRGFGYDMLMACSAATFGLNRAYDSIVAGSAGCVLAINPEILTPQVNYRDRQSHFIFGDVCTAMIMESVNTCNAEAPFHVLSTRSLTRYSKNIRSNFGYLSRVTDEAPYGPDKLFHQAGKSVFDELSTLTVDHINDHLAAHGLGPEDVSRFYLHQANINMNRMVVKRLFGRAVSEERAPIVLDRFGNTASAGSILAFHLHHGETASGEIAMICSFGAGYSVGSLLLVRQ